jgi:hypothetical protein
MHQDRKPGSMARAAQTEIRYSEDAPFVRLHPQAIMNMPEHTIDPPGEQRIIRSGGSRTGRCGVRSRGVVAPQGR